MVPMLGKVSSIQKAISAIDPVMNKMPVSTRSAPMTRSTVYKWRRNRAMKSMNGFIATAARMNGMPSPAE